MNQSKDAAFWQARYDAMRELTDELIYGLQATIRDQLPHMYPRTSTASMQVEEALTQHIKKAQEAFDENITKEFKARRSEGELQGQIASSDIRHGIWLIRYYESRNMGHFVKGIRGALLSLGEQLTKDEKEALNVT